MKQCLIATIFLFALSACQPANVEMVTPTPIQSTPTRQNLQIQTATILPTSTPHFLPTLTQTPTLPAASIISDMKAYKQDRPLDCEARAAIDWATYFGFTISEYDFQFGLPVSDNPDLGFVGTSDSLWGQTPPYAYGVHAGPVADLLQKYGVYAIAVKGMTLEELKRQIYLGHPVIAWVIGNCVGGVPTEYVDSKGNKTVVAAYEHVIIVIGYTTDRIRYYSAGKMYETPYEVFLNSWAVLGNMAIISGD
jgi:uncharacterized protein YvpB